MRVKKENNVSGIAEYFQYSRDLEIVEFRDARMFTRSRCTIRIRRCVCVGEGEGGSNFRVRRVIGYAASVLVLRQAHVPVFAPFGAPPVLQDPLGRGVSDDQYRVVDQVRATEFVVVDTFAANRNQI